MPASLDNTGATQCKCLAGKAFHKLREIRRELCVNRTYTAFSLRSPPRRGQKIYAELTLHGRGITIFIKETGNRFRGYIVLTAPISRGGSKTFWLEQWSG